MSFVDVNSNIKCRIQKLQHGQIYAWHSHLINLSLVGHHCWAKESKEMRSRSQPAIVLFAVKAQNTAAHKTFMYWKKWTFCACPTCAPGFKDYQGLSKGSGKLLKAAPPLNFYGRTVFCCQAFYASKSCCIVFFLMFLFIFYLHLREEVIWQSTIH